MILYSDNSLIKKDFYEKYLSSSAGVKRREGAYLILEDGRKVLDAVSSGGINYFGPDFLNNTENPGKPASGGLPQLQDALTNIMPPRLSKLYFTRGRKQALKDALTLAVRYWQQHNQERNTFICFGGYGLCLAAALEEINRTNPDIRLKTEILPFPGYADGDTTVYRRENAIIDRLEIMLDEEPGKYAGIIMEPLVDTTGMQICSEEFMQKIQWSHRQFDTLLIFDEHQTGFGRTGQLFGFKTAQVEPDILCLGQGITGGAFNLSAVICSEAICEAGEAAGINDSDSIKNTPDNELLKISEAALKTLNYLSEFEPVFAGMQEEHEKHVEYLRPAGVFEKFRIKGTIAAFDLKKEYAVHADRIAEAAFEAGLLLNPLGKTIYLMPPYCAGKGERAQMYDLLRKLPIGQQQK